ncbi:MAG: TatD family hydrolase [Prolixibacteraceae bacterium]|jgi:TatD DNase family protein|nr:TatD family hydrolase [Prolixibacteraceae bacterium]
MPQFIDIHTHRSYDSTSQTMSVKNLLLHESNKFEIDNSKFYSAGWHPWFIKNYDPEVIKNTIVEYAAEVYIVTIGECGIDRAIDASLEQQIEVFKLHIQCAKNEKKPLLIHAVRSYSDILHVLKDEKYSGIVILHDFRGNMQQVEQFLKFNTFFSFGNALFSGSKIASIFKQLHLERVFFETDENDIPIEKIYLRAAEIRNIPVENLKKQVIKNFKRIFGYELD